MKHFILKYLTPGLLTCAATFASCNDWSEPESIDIHNPSVEELSPEIYARYLQALRDYKSTDHKMTIIGVKNGTEAPTHRNEHITRMPDSVDFICLTNPAQVHPALNGEMAEVREKKGIRTIYDISYERIETSWEKLIEEHAEQSGESETDEARFLTFVGKQTLTQLAYCDRYDFDGVIASFEGQSTLHMTNEEKAVYTLRQQTFLSAFETWAQTHTEKVLFFQGSPQNLTDRALLPRCRYIILPALSAVSSDYFSMAALMASIEGVPTDRFIIGVTCPSISDPDNENGYFATVDTDGKTKMRATKGAALWSLIPAAYTKAGISISDAQDDYYNITLVYKNIREAVNLMNPAPKNR